MPDKALMGSTRRKETVRYGEWRQLDLFVPAPEKPSWWRRDEQGNIFIPWFAANDPTF